MSRPGFWLGLQELFLRYRVSRPLAARPRLFFSIPAGLAAWFLTPADWRYETRALVAWNCASLLYLGLAGLMMFRDDHAALTRRASRQDDGAFAILTLSVLATIASMAAIVAELASVKEVTGTARGLHIGLAALTIFTAWAFIHMMFALHYAHEYARERRGKPPPDAEHPPCLQFPGTTKPTYVDFLYFSYVIGVACQTADVSVVSENMRRNALVHGIVSFFFNTTILALTINIAAGLI